LIGALGNVGRSVVEQLLGLGEPVRASVRRTGGEEFPAAVEVVAADLRDLEKAELEIEELSEHEGRKVFGDSGQLEAILDFLRNAAEGGLPATGVVREVLGRAPLSYRQWVIDHFAQA
jgi:nucleoside-diphosphate-sugar epimerase